MVAALSADRKYLLVAVVNATESEQKFDLSVTGAHVAGPSTLWQLTGSSIDAVNVVGQPAKLALNETSIGSAPPTVTVAPISVNLYQFPLAGAGQ